VLDVDQVVRGVAELRLPAMGGGVARCRIGRREILRRHFCRRSEGRIVERRQILLHRPAGGARGQALRPRAAALPVGFGADETAINGKTLAADQTLGQAPLDRRLEEPAQQVAVAETAVAVLREGRMIRHRAIKAEPAEPPVGQVQVNLFAQPALRADAVRVADNQHPDQQLRINRGPPLVAVERPQILADRRQIDEPVNRAQKVVDRNMTLKTEAVKQRLLLNRPLAHHRHIPHSLGASESEHNHCRKTDFFNTIDPRRKFGNRTPRRPSAWMYPLPA
jgi:hypothetical protein